MARTHQTPEVLRERLLRLADDPCVIAASDWPGPVLAERLLTKLLRP